MISPSPSLNKERIRHLADVIEKVPPARSADIWADDAPLTSFRMSDWHCGTAGCIAGWAAQVFGSPMLDTRDIATAASAALGLSPEMKNRLFAPRMGGILHKITPVDAAVTLRKLADTGKVDWSHVEATS